MPEAAAGDSDEFADLRAMLQSGDITEEQYNELTGCAATDRGHPKAMGPAMDADLERVLQESQRAEEKRARDRSTSNAASAQKATTAKPNTAPTRTLSWKDSQLMAALAEVSELEQKVRGLQKDLRQRDEKIQTLQVVKIQHEEMQDKHETVQGQLEYHRAHCAKLQTENKGLRQDAEARRAEIQLLEQKVASLEAQIANGAGVRIATPSPSAAGGKKKSKFSWPSPDALRMSKKLDEEKARVRELEQRLQKSQRSEADVVGMTFGDVMERFSNAWLEVGNKALQDGLCTEKDLLGEGSVMRVPTLVMMNTAFDGSLAPVAEGMEDLQEVRFPACDITVSVRNLEAMDRFSPLRSLGLQLGKMQRRMVGLQLTERQLSEIQRGIITHDAEDPKLVLEIAKALFPDAKKKDAVMDLIKIAKAAASKMQSLDVIEAMHAGICAMWATRSDALTSEQVLSELFETEEQYTYTLRGLRGVMANQLQRLQPDWCLPDATKQDLPSHECEPFYQNLQALYEAHSEEKFEQLRFEHLAENQRNTSNVGDKGDQDPPPWTHMDLTRTRLVGRPAADMDQSACGFLQADLYCDPKRLHRAPQPTGPWNPATLTPNLNPSPDRQDLVVKMLNRAMKSTGKNVNPKHAEVKEGIQKALAHEDFGGNSLQGVFMSPMQRTITYMLILERLMKTTQDAGQLAGMEVAHAEIKASIQVMDNATRAHRSLRSLVTKCQGLEWRGLVTEHQSLVREGDGLIYGQGSVRLFLVLERLFICVAPEDTTEEPGDSLMMRRQESGIMAPSSQKASKAVKWRCVSEVPVRSDLCGVERCGECKIKVQMFRHPEQSFEITLDTPGDCERWLSDLHQQLRAGEDFPEPAWGGSVQGHHMPIPDAPPPPTTAWEAPPPPPEADHGFGLAPQSASARSAFDPQLYWVETVDPQGHPYYYRQDDPRITQWERPAGTILKAASQGGGRRPGGAGLRETVA